MLKITNAGEASALAAFVGKVQPENLRLHLYTNNLVLADNSVAGDMTEPTFAGYASATLTGSLWTVQMGAPAVAEYLEQAFICNDTPTPPQTIYGYYVTRDGSGEMMWAEKFPIPQIISVVGERITVSPRLTARDESD